MTEIVLFGIFGTVAIAGALSVILARNPIYSALGLMSTMFSLAVFYIMHLGHFVAAIQIIVYTGAVMTLFLFVIMLIGVDRSEDTAEQLPNQRRIVVGLGLTIA
ncbi:MAG: NADH-quinone oxidoreductase subunit J, partial [Acidimicrobiia bacterium]|nr:NADH-quinone oxidoreductase subunit J [Acidimicrobiia bacterium]